MNLNRNNSLLLVIDIQSKLFPHIADNEALESNCNKLIQGAKVLGLPILVTEQYTKGLGFTLDSIKNNLGDYYKPIEKAEFSCYRNEEFKKLLDSLNKSTIILCGIESHVCVLQTCIDLINEGYAVAVVNDCVSSRNLSDKHIAIERMRDEGAVITSYESALFELTVYSNIPEFKEISKIVK